MAHFPVIVTLPLVGIVTVGPGAISLREGRTNQIPFSVDR